MEDKEHPLVYCHIIHFENRYLIKKCIDSLKAQNGYVLGNNLIIRITNNSYNQESKKSLEALKEDGIELLYNHQNLGYSYPFNQAFKQAIQLGAKYFLELNPDIILTNNLILELVNTLDLDTSCSFATPKILRLDDDYLPKEPATIDSVGIHFTKNLRHLDTGSNQLDQGQYQQPCYVAGGTGACLLIRVNFINDAHLPTEENTKDKLFDEAFVIYREDADIAWRSLILGWNTRYVPEAICYHKRSVLPENREKTSPILNAFSVRNRFLLQLNNFSYLSNLNCVVEGFFRNILVLIGVLIKERSSFMGLRSSVILRARAFRNRAKTFKNRKRSYSEIRKWFSNNPIRVPCVSLKKSDKKIKSLRAVIVNFFDEEATSTLADNLLKIKEELKESLKIEITIVDNSNSCKKSILSSLQSQVELICPATNLGFSGAINLALEEKNEDSFLILNSDLELTKEVIACLKDSLDNSRNIGAISPVLLSEEKQLQNKYLPKEFPTLFSLMLEVLGVKNLFKKIFSFDRVRKKDLQLKYLENFDSKCPPPDRAYYNEDFPIAVEQLAAACILIRKEVFLMLSGFDQNFYPAWFEDVDFAKRLSQTHFVSAINRKAKVIHKGGASLRNLRAGEFNYYYLRNLKLFSKNHLKTKDHFILSLLFPLLLLPRLAMIIYKSHKKDTIFNAIRDCSSIVKLILKFN